MKKFLEKKSNVMVMVVLLIIIAIVVLVCGFVLFKEEENLGPNLDEIYYAYPEEVKDIYYNLIDATCEGDLYFDEAVLDGGAISIKDVDKGTLLNLVLNNINRKALLSDKFEYDLVLETADNLLYEDIDFGNLLNGFYHVGHTYSLKNGVVTRKEKKCNADIRYISHLVGYSDGEDFLFIDVNFGYLKNGILYNLLDEKLGKYDGNTYELADLYSTSPAYRFNYKIDGETYKLDTVELNSKP